jgi:hypothetical protein
VVGAALLCLSPRPAGWLAPTHAAGPECGHVIFWLQVWEKDESEAAAAADEEEAGGAANGASAGRESFDVVVSDVADANALYVQVWGGWVLPHWLGGARGPVSLGSCGHPEMPSCAASPCQ